MNIISLGKGLNAALDSLINNSLVLIAGAGLSQAPPANLPSAAELAKEAKNSYDATYGSTRPPLPTNIEDQAEFFFERNQLDTHYFAELIDQHAFSGQPNDGHYAAADLLMVRALRSAVTTNVDTMIETAGRMLFGNVEAIIDGQAAAALPDDIVPLLKIHGCWVRDRAHMIWAPGQLTAEPVQGRIENSKNWLNVNLLNKDLLIVGFWTDWDYLNEVLSNALGGVRASRVIVVSPDRTDQFESKAPHLFALGEQATESFDHVQVSGHCFLNELRRLFSQVFVRRVLFSGSEEFERQTGIAPERAWLEPPDLDATTLWQIRRDLEGCVANEPARKRKPPNGETLVGLTLLQLQAKGATPDGAYWLLNNRRIRVVRSPIRALHKVIAEFDRGIAPAIAPDLSIAVGAEETPLPANVARPEPTATVVRGQKGRWLTRQSAIHTLNL